MEFDHQCDRDGVDCFDLHRLQHPAERAGALDNAVAGRVAGDLLVRFTAASFPRQGAMIRAR